MESEWQPIETAPKDGTKILLYGTYQWDSYFERQKIGAVVGYWDYESYDDAGYWMVEQNTAYQCYCQPTHWMPLPLPPNDI